GIGVIPAYGLIYIAHAGYDIQNPTAYKGRLMQIPSAEEQVRFLTNIQRLLTDGDFVATYKYALLKALSDIALERKGIESGAPLSISTTEIAEKFIAYYWHHAVPYQGQLLHQNSNRNKPAFVVTKISEARAEWGQTIAAAKHHKKWTSLVNTIARNVQKMPLWRLQVISKSEIHDFLYPQRTESESVLEDRKSTRLNSS